MSEWKEYPLKMLGGVVTGKTPSKNNPEDWGGEIPFVTPTDYKNYRKYASLSARNLSTAGIEKFKNKVLPPKSVIVTCIGSDMGKVVMNTVEVITNQQINSIIPDTKVVDSDFLYYCLVDMYDMLRAYGGDGTAVPIVNKGDFENLQTSLPEHPEQKAIASVLSSLDDKIDLLHRQNKTLEAMAETLFRQWFVEEAQEEKIIADLINFNPTRKLAKGMSAPYLEMAALSTTTFAPEGWYDREFSSGTKFVNGDTLLARITPCLENGKTAFITFLEPDQVAWGSTEYIVMRPKDFLHPFFAYTLSRNNDFRDYAEGCLEGSSGRQRVNVDHLRNYDIKLPSIEVLSGFNAFAESTVQKLHANAEQIRTLEKLRDTLLPKLMSGEVRVEYEN